MTAPILLTAGMMSAAVCLAQQLPPAPQPAARAHSSAWQLGARATYLGVGVADVDTNRAGALKLKETRGAEVTMVNENTPAAKADIRVGDVILEYNGQPVEGTAELQRLVRETPSGRQVKIGLWRNGTPLTVTATVEESKGVHIYGRSLAPYSGDELFPNLNLPGVSPMASIDIPHMVTTLGISALGVECQALAPNSQLAEYFGVKDGLLVVSVKAGSPADKAGLKAGDVIVKVGEAHIGSYRDLSAALRNNRAKLTFPASVMRNKHEMALMVTQSDNGQADRF